MTNNEMLQADFLDVLFQNRNKAYGAYLLRKTYPQRLLLSTGIAALFVTGILLLVSQKNKNNALAPLEAPPPVVLAEYTLLPPDEEKPAVMPSPAQTVATRHFTNLISIVRDDAVDEREVPPVIDLENTAVGGANVDGPAWMEAQQPSAPAVAAPAAAPLPTAAPEVWSNDAVAKMAEFPGGAGAFQRYLARYLPQPEGLAPGEAKTIKVQFVIDAEGSISRIVVVQSGGNELDSAVTRVLQKAPRWKPAIHNGREVAMVFTQPITLVGAEE